MPDFVTLHRRSETKEDLWIDMHVKQEEKVVMEDPAARGKMMILKEASASGLLVMHPKKKNVFTEPSREVFYDD